MTLYKTVADLNGGTQVEMTDAEEAEIVAQQAISAAAAPRLAKLAAITALEAQQTPRRMREAMSDPTFINNLNAQIATLRSQL